MLMPSAVELNPMSGILSVITDETRRDLEQALMWICACSGGAARYIK